jgi:transposase
LTGLEAREAAWALEVIGLSETRIAELDVLMAEERAGDADIARLAGVPGIGPVVSLAYAAYVGDGSRFERAAQVAGH